MDAIEQAKQIANESDQLVATLEAGLPGQGGTVPPLEYSSSTNSCTVDPETGVVTLTTLLYPGETPILPAPGDEAPVNEAPADDAPEAPAGQIPAQ